eukprot:TRINITY_DN1823_c1_g3_i4.p1 TRINITY_DN1823_c1_g3~~TRINITY_DN1823_c1_g3_i4.p1  ORF type:complete len:331 (-),score=86.01 TRINITY_DN1823_c1_g3_i4:679-1671(-)
MTQSMTQPLHHCPLLHNLHARAPSHRFTVICHHPFLSALPLSSCLLNVRAHTCISTVLLCTCIHHSADAHSVLARCCVMTPRAVYAWLTYEALQNPVSLAGFSGGAFDLDTLTKGFTQEVSVADGWAHFIAQDLFVGRWVYLDSKRNSVWAAHSLTLCYLFGPIGVLSHLLTRGLSGIFRQDVTDILDIGVATERETKAPKSKPKAALPPSLPPSAPSKPAVAPRGASRGSSGAQSTAMRSSSSSGGSSSSSSAPSKAMTRASGDSSSGASSGSGASSAPASSAPAAVKPESKSESVSAAQQQAIIVDANVVSSQPAGDTADRSAGKTTA